MSGRGRLSRLRGRSFDELRVRAKQRLAVWSERAGISSQTRVPSEGRFARLLAQGGDDSRAPSAAVLLERFRARTTPRFFAPFSEPEDVVATLRRRWPELEGRVLERAERIRQGQFDLLGRSRVDFGTPIDWHLDPLTGARPGPTHWSRINYLDPKVAGDYKLIWELNRHQYFVTLGKAYWYTGAERYAATFVEHLMAWMDANPPKRGINWASSLELAFRAISWIWGLYFFRSSPTLTPDAFLRTLKFLVLHGRHIETYLSTYHSPNTHLTGEALALLYLGTLFPELRDAARWRSVASSILIQQLDKHVRPDGSYFEQSTYYHRYTTDFYLQVSILGQLNGFPGGDALIREKLQALLTPLMYLTQPGGRTPLMGDDDGGRLLFLDERAHDDFRATLATSAVLFERPDYRHVAGEAAEETIWLLGCAGLRAFDALESMPPADTSRAFPDCGSYVMRDGWERDSSSLVIDCGPHDARGHAHDDALGVTLVARGTPVLVDPGTYTYTSPSELRDHFRSSLAHNTVTVAGQSSSVPDEPFSWRHVARSALRAWTSGARCDYFEGVQDGYARLTPPALHSRAVLFLKGDYWVMRDRVSTDADYDVEVRLHFAPGIALEITSPSRAAALWGRDSQPAMLDIGVFGHQGALRAAEGWVSPAYGALSRAPTCVFTARGRGPREVVSFFVPRRGHEEAVQIDERRATNGRAFVIAGRDFEDTVLVGGGGGQAAGGDLAATAEWAWVRCPRPGGLPSEFVMVNGRRLSWRGRPLVEADVPVRYIAARRQGVELHVETDAGGRCEVDLLSAERIIRSGELVPTGRVLAARTAAAPLAVS